jgi:hypothetical protein
MSISTSTSNNFHDTKDHLDIVDFIESTIELQEESIKADRELEAEINDLKLSNSLEL